MPMMPPMPPGPGGGAPPGMGGGAIAQVLQRLMQNPAAVKGMQNYMQGLPPTQGLPQPLPREMTDPGGGPPPGPAGMGAPPQGPPDMPPTGPGAAQDPAEKMAQDKIDTAGQTWDGTDAPTKNDIERLMEDPSASNIKSFDAQFGEGMAEKYLGESTAEDQGETQDAEDAEGDQGSASQSEYDQ